MKNFFTLLLLLLLAAATCCGQDQICVRHVVVPHYPPLANMARLEGMVAVEVEIAPDGHVVSTRASGPNEILARPAEVNIRQWTFSATAPGENRNRQFTVTYLFKLEGKEVYHPSSTVTMDLPDRVEIVAEPGKLNTSTSRSP